MSSIIQRLVVLWSWSLLPKKQTQTSLNRIEVNFTFFKKEEKIKLKTYSKYMAIFKDFFF